MVQIIILIASGRILARFGYAKPLLLIGPAFMSIGTGLLYTIGPDTSQGHIMGYEALMAFGEWEGGLQYALIDAPNLLVAIS